MVMVHRLLKQSELSEKAMLLALALCCFHPMFYILAGSVNNDMLMVFFALANILYIIKWYKQPTVKNTVFLAITCGCAIMSKLTGALTAPVIAVVFLIKLLEKQKETPRSKLFGGCVLFGVISLPLGLWFPIRNFIRFGQPLTYVRKLPESADVYCGNYTLAERFFSFPASEFVKSLYCIPQEDFNIWIYTLKCSVFGEFEYKGAEAAGVVLLFFNIALIMLSLAAMAYVLLRDKRKETFIAKATLALTWLVTMTAFIKTNLDLPYGCTMDFRYIVPTLVCGSVFIALMYDVLAKRKGAMSKSINIAITTLTVAFSVSSLVFYLSVG
jgi:4-amino-4-deoxy-L-arabinose transferase-like glycosyltransferase